MTNQPINSRKVSEGLLKLGRRFKCRRHLLPLNNLRDGLFLFKRFITSVPKSPQGSTSASEQGTAIPIELHPNKKQKTRTAALKWNLKAKPSADLERSWNPCRALSACAWAHPSSETHKAAPGWRVKSSQQSFFKAVLFSCWSCDWLGLTQAKMIFTLQAVGCKCWTNTRGVAPFSFFFSFFSFQHLC